MPILNQYSEINRLITTHTSENKPINNQQNQLLLLSEQNNANRLADQFGGAVYQGSASPCYNCHGLTFANKRTGIYEDEEIWKIIQTEYIEIKVLRDVLVGDIILYLYGEDLNYISHSGIVVVANHTTIISEIKIYSKILKGREIVHEPTKCPYNNHQRRYYRINHVNRVQNTT